MSSAIAIAIPIARTQASQRASSQQASIPEAADGLSEALRAQAAGVTAALAGAQADRANAGPPAASIRPPLGSGLFPQPLLIAAARLAANGVFASPETQAALVMTRQQAVSFTVHEDGFSTTHTSSQLTVGQALASQGVRVSEGDLISPPAGSELAAGAHIYISHAVDVRLVVAGTEHRIRTRSQNVGDVLSQAGIGLAPLDRVTPRASKPVSSGMTIRVTTVREITEVVEEPIAYASIVQYDAQLARGQRVFVQGGSDGWVRREYTVRQVNGQETRRQLVSETAMPPTDEIVTIGTYVKPVAPVVAAAVTAPVGDLACSRTLNVYATWYTAASAGGSGTTATGTAVYKGIVAVDPRVIPLGTRMYIPGYGYGLAADTGGGIVGNMIDLGYGPDDVKDWRTRWVDICIL